MMRRDHYMVTVVRPVSPPSILELRMEANMFVTHYDLAMNCLFFDGRFVHEDIYLFIYLFVCLFCLFVRLSVYLFVYLFIC